MLGRVLALLAMRAIVWVNAGWNPDSGVLGSARGVLEHQCRSIKSAAEPQSFAARLARMPVWLGFVLFIAAWAQPIGIVAIRRTVFSDPVGVAICSFGPVWGDLVAQNAGYRVEPGCRIKARAQARARRPLSVYAPSHLHRRSAHGTGNGHCLRLASFAVGFWIKLNQEETLLLRSFPDQYPAYKTRVKSLIPYLF